MEQQNFNQILYIIIRVRKTFTLCKNIFNCEINFYIEIKSINHFFLLLYSDWYVETQLPMISKQERH